MASSIGFMAIARGARRIDLADGFSAAKIRFHSDIVAGNISMRQSPNQLVDCPTTNVFRMNVDRRERRIQSGEQRRFVIAGNHTETMTDLQPAFRKRPIHHCCDRVGRNEQTGRSLRQRQQLLD